MKKYNKLILEVLVTSVAGILLQKITKFDIYLTVIFVLLVIIIILVYEITPFPRPTHDDGLENNNLLQDAGIKEITPKKGGSDKRKPSFLLEATNSIDIMGATLKTYWIDGNLFPIYLAKAGKKENVTIQILLLDPDSGHVEEKAGEEGVSGATFRSQIEITLRELKRLKEHYKIKNIKLYLYDEFPVWNMIIVDHKFAKINYYPREKSGGEAPYYTLTDEGGYSLLPSFITYFEKIREKSEEQSWDEINTEE